MSESRPRATRKEVAEAVRQIKAYYERGTQSLEELPERGRYGARAIAAQAERLGWAETKLRKARQFADPVLGYSRDQLHELFSLLREHRPVFGVCHVGVLVSAPWAEGRAELQRRCILGNWSKDRLEAEVKVLLGTRNWGGRRRRVADDPVLALVQVYEMADTWLRWHTVAAGEPRGNGHSASVLDRLPESVRAKVHKITGAMRRLRTAVARARERARTG
jgi:hypothetical protein